MSAAASLPLHLLPILVLTLVADGRLSTMRAGWVGSAYMIGQMCVVILLPILRIERVVRGGALLALAVLVATTILSNYPHEAALLAAWLSIGMACGSLHFLATTTAAAAADRRMAFAARMAMSSAFGALVISISQSTGTKIDYFLLTHQLAVAFFVIIGLGLLLYRTPSLVTSPTTRTQAEVSADSKLMNAGFLVLFILFVGQHGLWAFALQVVQQKGLLLEQVLWAIVACKFAGAAFALASGWSGGKSKINPSVLLPALTVSAGGLCAFSAHNAPTFWIGLLLWEIGLNVLSARYQACLAQRDPRRAGMWMTSAIFLGAAIGPAIAGWAFSLAHFNIFVVFGVGTGLLPIAWAFAASRASRRAASPAPASAQR